MAERKSSIRKRCRSIPRHLRPIIRTSGSRTSDSDEHFFVIVATWRLSPEAGPRRFSWLDAVWLLFLVGLAVLPPRGEWHKQVILAAIGIVQLLEGWLIGHLPQRGAFYAVVLKIVLATVLIDHTAEIGIN